MQPENSGKTIIKILKKRRKTYMILDDNSEIEINEDVVAEFLLYSGKKVTDKELKSIQLNYVLSDCFSYTYGLLAKRSYTEKEIRDKLKKKGFSGAFIEQVVVKVKSLKLIDDENYTKEYIEYAKNKGYGPLRISKDLHLKGIDKLLVDSLLENNKDTFNIDERLINKILKQFSNSNDKKRRQQIYEVLIRRGFNNEVIIHILDEYVVYDVEHEKKLLRIDYLKIKEICKRKYSKEDFAKQMVSKLMQKSYNYHDIMVIKEENND